MLKRPFSSLDHELLYSDDCHDDNDYDDDDDDEYDAVDKHTDVPDIIESIDVSIDNVAKIKNINTSDKVDACTETETHENICTKCKALIPVKECMKYKTTLANDYHYKYCIECKEKNNKYNNKLYFKRKENKLCVKCRISLPADYKHIKCFDCKLIYINKYAKLKAEKKCVKCKIDLPDGYIRKQCITCKEISNKLSKIAR